MTGRSKSVLLAVAAALAISARGKLVLSQEAAPPAGESAEQPPGTLAELAESLSVALVENGPDELWKLELRNDGSQPVVLVGDPGLLRLDVSAPKRSATCRLPEPLWPKTGKRESQIVLQPGGVYRRRFDARFFCFADLRQTLLVPGARVIPHFGWPPETRQVRRGGKRVVETLPPTAPFVAWWAPPQTSPTPPSEPSDAAPDPENTALISLPPHDAAPPKEGLKELIGAALVLSDAYAPWSAAAPAPSGDGVALRMLAGSDALDEKEATVTLGLVNSSTRARYIFARRELFEYAVTGPRGKFTCSASEIGPPDVASFEKIAAGGTDSMVVRLIEVCPRGSFSHPGLYEVRGRFDARWSGEGHGLDAFTGKLAAEQPALVRVRSGDHSAFTRPAALLAGGVGGPQLGRPAVPPPSMGEPNLDGAMPLDVPPEGMPEHEGLPPAVEPPPMPEPPPSMEGVVE